LLRNSEAENSGARKFSDYFFADRFLLIEAGGVDDSAPLHAIDLGDEPPHDCGFFRISFVEASRKREEKLVMYDAGKNAARERWLEVSHFVLLLRDQVTMRPAL
jgi:hypothetical protein